MDVVDAAKRSSMMAGIGSKNTSPELMVRRFLHSKGFRFRLHVSGLAGKPDIVLAKHHVAIYVHGCFWHRHIDCKYATMPSTNVDFWKSKFDGNVARDARNILALEKLHWKVIVIWECELRKTDCGKRLARLVAEILSAAS